MRSTLTQSAPRRLEESHSREKEQGSTLQKTPLSRGYDKTRLYRSAPRRLENNSDPMAESSSANSLVTEVKTALAEITSLLTNVVNRVENVEMELQQQKKSCPSSSSDCTSAKEQVHVPRVVWVRDNAHTSFEDTPLYPFSQK